jgi:putative tricarboxylic transport membrane protein
MSEASPEAGQGTGQGPGQGPSHRNVEMGVAVVVALFGVLIMAGSLKVGINWGVEGPRSGFFPFYVGLIIVFSSGLILYQVLTGARSDKLFADWGQLRSVTSVVIPTAVYVATLPYLGIYLTSAVLIAAFMKVLGKYAWGITLAVSIGVPIVTYLMFEKWFLVPLPKGPIENWLGL